MEISKTKTTKLTEEEMTIATKKPALEKIITRRPNGTIRVQTRINETDKTDQSFKEDADVNNILSKWAKQGTIPNFTPGVYADVSELGNFQTAMESVTKAQDDFNNLPAELRERFNQSPTALVNFLKNPNNREEAQKLGLIPTPKKITAPGTPGTDASASALSSESNQQTKQKKPTQEAHTSEQ